jgi:FkbH-like protein
MPDATKDATWASKDWLDFQALNRISRNSSAQGGTRVALLGDSATQFLAMAITSVAKIRRTPVALLEANFDQIHRELMDPESETYAFKPEFLLVYRCSRKLLARFYQLEPAVRAGFADEVLADLQDLVDAAQRHSGAKLVIFNFCEIFDSVFGNFANKVSTSFLYQIRKLNLGLMDLAQSQGNLFILDMAALQAYYGHRFQHAQMSVFADTSVHLDSLSAIADRLMDIISAVQGKAKKCVILDLDDTLWGGVIGDDGLEGIQLGETGIGKAFSAFQIWCRELQQRGILLAVCSKNMEDNVRRVFTEHPDMILRLDDIAVLVANWENKADNIRHIQKVLNIGFDSMVFIDDSPFERNLVRAELPDVTVPEMPADPAEYLPFLQRANLFETASHSSEDLLRTRSYQAEANRRQTQTQFTSLDDYLASLNMVATFGPCDSLHCDRVAQLSQRSNQFNLRTVRYTEPEVANLIHSPRHRTQILRLSDKFGDYGLISAAILEIQGDWLFLENWFMSCRVLGRGVEQVMLDRLLALCQETKTLGIRGEYLPSGKNSMVQNLLADLGFRPEGEQWLLAVQDLKDCAPQGHFIRMEQLNAPASE